MKRSAKLGITSVVLLLIALVAHSWLYPIAFVSVGFSGLFGLLAAQQGSKWWLTVPGVILAGIAFGFYVGFHSF